MEFVNRYNAVGEKKGVLNTAPSMTQQQFKEESDINNIIARYRTTGILVDPLSQSDRQPSFDDFSSMPDFQTAQNLVISANNRFMSLPSKIRERFNNDPAVFFDYVRGLKKGGPEYDEAIRLGIVNGSIGGDPKVVTKSSEDGKKVDSGVES